MTRSASIVYRISSALLKAPGLASARRILSKIVGWFPLTLRGLVALPLLFLLRQSYGVKQSDYILLVVGTGGMALIALAVFAVLATALVLKLSLKIPSLEGLQFETGNRIKTGLKFRILGWIPFVQILLEWKEPASIRCELLSHWGRLEEEIVPQGRGIQEKIVREFRVVDALGLARIRFQVSSRQPIKIFPRLGNVQIQQIFKQYSAGDLLSHPEGEPVGDRSDLRRYVRGDPLKHIVWKVYARTQRLMVRQMERAVSPQQRTFAYFIASKEDEAAASTARTALERGMLGKDYLFLADGEKNPVDQSGEGVDQIVRSAKQGMPVAQGLKGFVDQAQGEKISGCVVFASAQSEEWIDKLIEAARNYEGRIHAILSLERFLLDPPRSSFLKRLFWEDRSEDSVRRIHKIHQRLIQQRIQVSWIDPQSGKAFSPALLERN